ncbi:MAG TPA: hypothetical protein VK179_16525 [Bacteroidales bacterium]|nr:hypothetical protein [Bacteroidales bacterium]
MKKYFIASVTDDYLGTIDEVASRLQNLGCEITQVLKISGVITGKVEQDRDLDDLRIQGVASVEKQKQVRKIRR